MEIKTRHLLLAPERFADLSASSPATAWRARLMEAGVMDVAADGSEEGRLIASLQRLAREEEAILGDQHDPPLTLIELAILVLGGVTLLLLLIGLTKSAPGGFFCFGLFGLGPFQAAWRGWRRARRRGRRGVSEELRATLDQLLARNFIAGMGDCLVESVPVRAWLQARILSVGRDVQAAGERIARLRGVRERMRALNAQMGQPEEDAETEALAGAVSTAEAGRERVRRLQIELSAKLAALDGRLTERRLWAERRLLSAQLDRMEQGAAAQRPISADLAAIEGELTLIDRQIREEQARLEAGLEVRGLLSGPGGAGDPGDPGAG